MAENVLRVLVDSTYILPGFGIGITGLSKRDLMLLEKLFINQVVRGDYNGYA